MTGPTTSGWSSSSDQFEETFTLCADETERAAFLTNLCYAATIPGGRLVVVAAMRADFYHRCASYPQLAALAARQFLVSPIGAAGLRDVIEQPAWRAGLELQPGLVATVMGDVADRPGSLPLLEYVLWEVWQHRQGHLLTVEAYVASGGVEGAFGAAGHHHLRRLHCHSAADCPPGAVAPDPAGGRRQGHPPPRRDRRAAHPPDQETDLEVVVKALADERLLTTSRDEATGARLVDVAHEALIQGWPTLRDWIEENRELLLAQRRLGEAAADWAGNGREEGFLWRGARLATWQDRPLEDLNDLEREFLDSSRERETRERAARRRRVRVSLAGLSTALAIISALAIVVSFQRDLAFSRERVASAENQLEADPELSIMLARRAYELRPTPEAGAALRQAIQESRVRATLRHDGPVRSVAFSPEGRLATAGDDGTVRMWDLVGAAPIVLRGHNSWVQDVAFGPDGQQLASASDDGTLRVWPLAGGVDPIVLHGRDDPVYGVAFSSNGQRVVSTGQDAIVHVWDPIGGPALVMLRGHQGPTIGVAFSSDGQQLASAGADGTVRVWMCEVCGRIEEVLALAEQRVTRELTDEERVTFLHESPRS